MLTWLYFLIFFPPLWNNTLCVTNFCFNLFDFALASSLVCIFMYKLAPLGEALWYSSEKDECWNMQRIYYVLGFADLMVQ